MKFNTYTLKIIKSTNRS